MDFRAGEDGASEDVWLGVYAKCNFSLCSVDRGSPVGLLFSYRSAVDVCECGVSRHSGEP